MALKILIAHYSRSGHTARLADALAREFESRGVVVAREKISALRDWNKWLLPIPLLPLLPLLPLYLVWPAFRRLWHRIYLQPRQGIGRLQYPSVRGFDHVLIGTPKWLYISYPVARWLDTVKGLDGADVSPFATFCGPPLKVFELEMLFKPLSACLARRGASIGAQLAVSSNYHAYFVFGEMELLFRWLSQKAFGRPLTDFTLDGEVGQAEIQRYCDQVMGITSQRMAGRVLPA
jgi:hypothetical protein